MIELRFWNILPDEPATHVQRGLTGVTITAGAITGLATQAMVVALVDEQGRWRPTGADQTYTNVSVVRYDEGEGTAQRSRRPGSSPAPRSARARPLRPGD